MEKETRLETIVKALDMKRAEDVQVLKVTDLTIIADYFVIATATSNTHAKTLADEVDVKLSREGFNPTRTEGYQSASWIILDYGDIVVHVFYKEARDLYKLEQLWADGEKIDISAYLTKE